MTDPSDIEVDPKATYVRLRGHRGASKIPNPLADDSDDGWIGHAETVKRMLNGGGVSQEHQLDVEQVTRGGWRFAFVETRDDALIEALEREGHEPLSSEAFASLLEGEPVEEVRIIRDALLACERSD